MSEIKTTYFLVRVQDTGIYDLLKVDANGNPIAINKEQQRTFMEPDTLRLFIDYNANIPPGCEIRSAPIPQEIIDTITTLVELLIIVNP